MTESQLPSVFEREPIQRFRQLLQEAALTSNAELHSMTLLDEVSRAMELLHEEREEARRAADRQRSLYEVSIRLTESLDIRDVLNEVLDQAIIQSDARYGSLMLLNERTGILTIAASRGLPEDIIRETAVRLGEGIAGYVAQSGTPRILPRGFKDRYSQLSKTAEEIMAAISVSLKARNEVIGVLNVRDRLDGSDFTHEDLELVVMLAAQAAAAIANSSLHDALQRRADELHALYNMGVTITSSRDRNQTLQRLLDQATTLLKARKGSVMIVRPQHDLLDIVVAHGLSENIIRDMKPRIGEGIAGAVALTGAPIVLKAGVKHPSSQSEAVAGDISAAISAPLQHEGQILGVLNVSDREDASDFDDEDLQLLLMLAQQAAIAIHKATMYQRLKEQFTGTVNALSVLLDSRDPYTDRHSARVAEYSRVIARRMGFTDEEMERIWLAALLHDVGKVAIRERILKKKGRLTDEEYDEMKRHPVISYDAIKNVPHAEDLLPAIRHHHEHYSAGGYPDNLEGERIPLWARILCVADTFDAMTSDRPYRKGMPVNIALNELLAKAGTQFDPNIVAIFHEAVASGEIDLYMNLYGR